MRIAFLINDKAGSAKVESGLAWLQQLAQAEPNYQFLLWTNKKKLPSFSQNVQVDHLLSLDAFFSIKTRWSLRKRIKATSPALLVTLSDGFTFETNCPQVVIFSDTHSDVNSAHLRALKKKASKAAATVFPSRATASHWQSLLPIAKDRVHTITPLPFPTAIPLNAAEKMKCQLEFTEGRQFFLLAEELRAEAPLVELLKAFSLFKKRQQTNMKLVLPFALDEELSSFAHKLSSYKFKEDVVITGTISVDTRARLAAAAYALLMIDPAGNTEAHIVEALQLEQPLLVPRTHSAEELAGPSALYTEPDNVQDLANKMMLIYKDETLRTQLILQGKEQYARVMETTPLERFRDLLHSFAS